LTLEGGTGTVKNTEEHYPSDPSTKFQDLSRDELLRLVGLYGTMVRALDGFWYISVMRQAGNDLALECDIQTWRGMIKYSLKRISEQFEIQGDDLETMFRALRYEPMFGETDYQVEFISDREAVMTVTGCPVLHALEKDGGGREAQICGVVEPIIMECYTSFFNPAIVSEALERPPRKDRDGICCRWRFTLPE
jgi:hypothetical protein